VEQAMKHKWSAVPTLAIALGVGGQALARNKHKD
jgi:hypothetical protein